MIRGIVFDLWNCLAHNAHPPDPMRLLARALGIEGEDGWARRIERGMMLAPADSIEGGLRQIEARQGLVVRDPEARREAVERWSRAGEDAALFPDVLRTLDTLRRRYRIGLCSNTQSFGLEFLDRDGLWDRIDASALSFEVGALKPHPEIFRTACVRLELAPETVLMVGDRVGADVRGAIASGMHALRLQRDDGGPQRPDIATLRDLTRLPEWLAGFTVGG